MKTFLKLTKVKLLVLLILSAGVFVLCEKDEFFDAPEQGGEQLLSGSEKSQPEAPDYEVLDAAPEYAMCGEYQELQLMAGKHIPAGNIRIANDQEYIYVAVEMMSDWRMGEVHLYMGDFAHVPLNKKLNPKIGHFPFKKEFMHPASAVYFRFMKNDFGSCFTVSLHAEVVKGEHQREEEKGGHESESAWMAGEQFNVSASWAMYNEYCVMPCEPIQKPDGEEYPENDCEAEERLFDLYAGKNIVVGQLAVTNTHDSLYVTYQITVADWYLKETHLYVGAMDDMPANPAYNPVVGHFPYKMQHENMQQEYTYVLPLGGMDPCYILAAHADIYRIGERDRMEKETVWSYGTRFPNAKRWGWYSDYCTQCLTR